MQSLTVRLFYFWGTYFLIPQFVCILQCFLWHHTTPSFINDNDALLVILWQKNNTIPLAGALQEWHQLQLSLFFVPSSNSSMLTMMALCWWFQLQLLSPFPFLTHQKALCELHATRIMKAFINNNDALHWWHQQQLLFDNNSMTALLQG